MTRRNGVVLGLLAIAALFLTTGCAVPGKWTGGGWIDSAAGAPAKATFGFNAHADDTTGDGNADAYKGRFQYRDHGANVSIHGVVEGVEYDPFLDADLIYGSYEPQPKRLGSGGSFDAYVIDNGEPGINGDFIDILIYDGVYAGYYNQGVIRGGNIQKHPPGE